MTSGLELVSESVEGLATRDLIRRSIGASAALRATLAVSAGELQAQAHLIPRPRGESNDGGSTETLPLLDRLARHRLDSISECELA